MENKTIDSRLLQIISENSGQESLKISMDTKIDDVGLSSISFIKMIVDIEEEFNIEFDDESLEFSKFDVIKDFVDYINEMWGK
jgi:acyl carrier protein